MTYHSDISDPNNPRQLAELIDALCEGEISQTQLAQLEELLRDDAAARNFYIDHMRLVTELEWQHVAGDVPSLLAQKSSLSFRPQQNRRIDLASIPRNAIYATVGSVAVAIILTVVWMLPDPAPVFVATIDDSIDARWDDQDLSVAFGTQLAVGRELHLTDGVVRIALEGGAKMIVESPAILELLSPDSARLVRGRLVGQVPRSDLQLTIQTPQATIVDLGTEFGVEVDHEGIALVHVFDGRVKLTPHAGHLAATKPMSSETLTAGSTRSVSSDGQQIREITLDDTLFIRDIPESSYELAVLQSNPLALWRLNDPDGSIEVTSLGRVNRPGLIGKGVRLGAPESGRAEQNNRVALLVGKHDGIDLGHDEQFALTAGFTLEAWVRPGLGVRDPQRIISSCSYVPRSGFSFGIVGKNARSALWETRQNPPPISLLITLHGLYSCVSTVGVESGRWSHVAAVIDPNGRPSLFINGHQVETHWRPTESESKFQQLPNVWGPRLIGVASSKPCYLGRHPPDAKAENYKAARWQGGIDEVAIFNRILSSKEILNHYQAGSSSNLDLD